MFDREAAENILKLLIFDFRTMEMIVLSFVYYIFLKLPKLLYKLILDLKQLWKICFDKIKKLLEKIY